MKWQVALIIRPLALIERHWHRRLGLRLRGRRAKTADPKPKLEPETPNPEPKTLKRRAAPRRRSTKKPNPEPKTLKRRAAPRRRSTKKPKLQILYLCWRTLARATKSLGFRV